MKDTKHRAGKATLFLLLAICCLFMPATLDAAGLQPQKASEGQSEVEAPLPPDAAENPHAKGSEAPKQPSPASYNESGNDILSETGLGTEQPGPPLPPEAPAPGSRNSSGTTDAPPYLGTEHAADSAGSIGGTTSGSVSAPNAEEKAVSPSDATPPKQPNGGTAPVTGLVQESGYFVLYIEGKPVTEPGWKEFKKQKYFIDGNGHVTAKMELPGNVWKFYKYRAKSSSWEKQSDLWEPVLAKLYYFNKSGNCTMVYDTETEQLKVRKNGKMRFARRAVYPLNNGKLYYFQKDGVRQTSAGWKKASSTEWYYVHRKGYVTARMVQQKNIWRYYAYQYSESKWKKQRDAWKSVNGKKYYFSHSGNCTRIYDPDTKKCQQYHDGKMATVKKAICRLPNGKLYYFDAKGIRITKKGWQKASPSQYMQLGKKGYVTGKLEKKSNDWRLYKYDYPKGHWQKQKDVWKTINKKVYYFSPSGNCTLLYYESARKCYEFRDGKQVLVQNDTRTIRGTSYYFGPDGVKTCSPGIYLTAAGRLIYADADGRVEKEIPGELLDYTVADGKITSCRIRDNNLMQYYTSDGNIRRQIDLTLPMVALTYDDGPSVHTQPILDLLGQYGGMATFFVVGNRVSAYPDTLIRACQMGCEIGNHTYSHKILTKLGTGEIQSQVGMANDAVRAITGFSPATMRPPGGGYNSNVSNAVGMPMILWSIDTLDWKTRNAARTQAAVLDHVKDGDIVLMHDLYQQTAAASAAIIPELINRGYQLVTITELSHCRGGMVPGAAYRSFP